MPHMANLPWMYSFFVFNLILLILFFCTRTTSSTNKMNHNENKKENIFKNKSWQW